MAETRKPLLGGNNDLTSRDSEDDGEASMKWKAFVRALYSEFLGTFLFFLPVFGGLANAYRCNWDPVFTNIALAFVTSLNGIAIIFCFSSLSGSQFHPGISFALWVVGKQSNRRLIGFTIMQLLASILVMIVVTGAFPDVGQGLYDSLAVQAPDDANYGNIFFTEFIATFVLTFVAFAMAFEEAESIRPSSVSLRAMQDDTLIMYSSTPQSKSGFAPFAIGFVLFGLVLFGGGSGVALNPVRIFGPAIFANKWDSIGIYILGEYVGCLVGALVVYYGPQSGKRNIENLKHDVSEIPNEIRQRMKFLGNRITGNSVDKV